MDAKWTNNCGRKDEFTLDELNRGHENAVKAVRSIIAKNPRLQAVVAERNAQAVPTQVQTTRKVSDGHKQKKTQGITLEGDLKFALDW